MSIFDLNAELKKIKNNTSKNELGMILIHNGVVRGTSRKENKQVKNMHLTYDKDKLNSAIEKTKSTKGIANVVVWINEGKLEVGDDIMYVIVAGDRRVNILKPFENLIEEIKSSVVIEKETIEQTA
jgi:molybdopterin synthase catalytic subunit